MADTQENGEELPELEGVAMEPVGMDPFDAPPPPPAPVVAAAPAPAPSSDSFSASDLAGDLDFDLPAPPPVAPKPVVAPPKVAAPGGFKPPAALFGQSGGFGASGLKPVAPVAKPAPAVVAPVVVAAKAPEVFDTRELAPPTQDSKEALRAALTADTAPAIIPPDAARALFQLARVLIQKGIISVEDIT